MAGRGLWACAMALCLLGLVQGKTLQLQEKRRDPAYDQFVLTTGAYKTELETIAYEESLKVTFSYDLPPLLYNSTMPERCLKEDTACQWESQLKAVLNMLRVNSTVAKGQNHAVALGQRRKRAWWSLAAQAIPILVDNFPKLLGLFRKTDASPQKAAVVEYRGMAVPRAGVAEMPKALSALTAHYKQLLTKWQSKQPEDRIEKMRDEVSKQVEGLKILSDGILQLVTLDKVMAVCESSLLPSRLVEWDHLKTAMVAAKTHLEKYNAEPVVTEAQWQLLYKMKTVTCAAVNSKFTVTLLLPIKRRGEEQTVYLLTPVPFRNQETVCYFFESAMTVVVLGTRTFFLPSDYCHPQEIFCHVPRDTNFDNVPNCLTALFPDSEVLTQECNPRCTPLVEPIVTGNGDGRLSVITAPGFPLTVACQNGDLQMPEERIGASQLTLPCDCELRCADKILVQKRLLCDGQKEPISVENLAPVQWLKTKRFAPFLSLIRQTQTVTETDLELTAKQVTKEQEFEFPKWAEDSVIMIGAMILMTLTRVVCSLWKRCLAKRNRSTETIYAQTLEQRGSVASLNT